MNDKSYFKALISLLYPAIHSGSLGKSMKRYNIPEIPVFNSAIECNGCVIKTRPKHVWVFFLFLIAFLINKLIILSPIRKHFIHREPLPLLLRATDRCYKRNALKQGWVFIMVHVHLMRHAVFVRFSDSDVNYKLESLDYVVTVSLLSSTKETIQKKLVKRIRENLANI